MTDRTKLAGQQRMAGRFQTLLAGSLLVLFGTAVGCVVEDPDYCDSDDICLQSKGSDYECSDTLRTCVPRSPDRCKSNDQCKDLALPLCDLSTRRCVACNASTPDGDAACARHKDTPYCGSNAAGGTRCVACRTHLDCPAATPICDAQACRPCRAHSDCEGTVNCHDGTACTNSLVCIGEGELGSGLAGRCALNGERGQVIYVRKEGCSAGTVGGTTPDSPRCDIEQGYTTAVTQTNRTYVRVIGEKNASGYYNAMGIIIDKGKFIFIGSSAKSLGVENRARILSQGTSFKTIELGDVTIDDFDITLNLPTQILLSCAATFDGTKVPNYTVRNSSLQGVNSPKNMGSASALVVDHCNLRVYNNIIGVQNTAALLDVNAQAFDTGIGLLYNFIACNRAVTADVFNNVIAGNMNAALNMGSVDCALWRINASFNTVIGNGRTVGGNPGGMIGPPNKASANVVIGQSLFANALSASGSQFRNADQVTWRDVVVSAADNVSQPGISKADFELETNFALKSPSTVNSSCCFDKAQPGTGDKFPAFDRAGTLRPKGAGYDLGALEVK